jgi:hypothetical protein
MSCPANRTVPTSGSVSISGSEASKESEPDIDCDPDIDPDPDADKPKRQGLLMHADKSGHLQNFASFHLHVTLLLGYQGPSQGQTVKAGRSL